MKRDKTKGDECIPTLEAPKWPTKGENLSEIIRILKEEFPGKDVEYLLVSIVKIQI